MRDGKYGFIKMVRQVVFFHIKNSPFLASLGIAMDIIHGMLWVSVIIATQLLFDSITMASQGEVNFSNVIFPIVLLSVVVFGQQIINGVANFMSDLVIDKNKGKLLSSMQRKLQRIPASNFEDTDFIDKVNKGQEGIVYFGYFAWMCIGLIAFYGTYFFSIGLYLFRLSPMLSFVLVLSFIPAILTQSVRVRIFTKLEEENAPLRREYDYYQTTIVEREYFKETRILGAYKFFHKLFAETLYIVTSKTWKAERRIALIQLSINIVSFIGFGISSYMLFLAVMDGDITVGAFAAVFSSLSIMFDMMSELVDRHMGNMNKNVGKVMNYLCLMDTPEVNGDKGYPNFRQGIVANNACYTYAGRANPAINNVNLTISADETVAIVGENGAGKSTLVRLLIGLYHSSDGIIKIGGLDSKKTDPLHIYKEISGVFQRYQRYKMTLNENVAISDTTYEMDDKKVKDVLDEVDFSCDFLRPEMILSPEFDGIDISGGQWQRLAIARGLYRASRFLVLDEPTASIDPIEETHIYNQFVKLIEGKCAIIVTHRLGSTKLADRIVVMDNGSIVDIGTHLELMSRPGKYADMWNAQKFWYDERV